MSRELQRALHDLERSVERVTQLRKAISAFANPDSKTSIVIDAADGFSYNTPMNREIAFEDFNQALKFQITKGDELRARLARAEKALSGTPE